MTKGQRTMNDYKLVPVEPIRRAMDALERFANDTLAGRNSAHELRELLAAAPVVQGEPVAWLSLCIKGDQKGQVEIDEPNAKATNPEYWTDAFPVYKTLKHAEQQPAGAALPPEITREMLGMIIDEVFGGGIEDASVIEDIYRVIARSAAPQPAEQQPCPKGIREGAPYDDPEFESLCREHEIWGTAAAAQCAVFWEAGKRAAEQQPAPDVAELVGKMGMLIAAGNRLNAEAEECTYAGNMAEVAGSEYWCEFRDALEAATEALAAHRKQWGDV